MTDTQIYLSIVNGVVVNRTVGPDVTVPLSVPEGETPVLMGYITEDDGVTFSPPPEP